MNKTDKEIVEEFKKWRMKEDNGATNHYATDDEIANWWLKQVQRVQGEVVEKAKPLLKEAMDFGFTNANKSGVDDIEKINQLLASLTDSSEGSEG